MIDYESRWLSAQHPLIRGVPHAGTYDDEEIYNPDTGKADLRKFKVKCPTCGRWGAPLLSPNTRRLQSGWTWAGLSHKEPYVDFLTKCKCGIAYTFRSQTPQ